jgi:hypothetical protein
MRNLGIARPGERLSVLCIDAHSDDIEIGATIPRLDRAQNALEVHWAVPNAVGPRAEMARASARAFLANAAKAFPNWKWGR